MEILIFLTCQFIMYFSAFNFCRTSLLIFTFLELPIEIINISKDQWQKHASLGARYIAIHKSTQMTLSSFTFSFLSHVPANIQIFDYRNSKHSNSIRKYTHFGIATFIGFLLIFIFVVFPLEIHTFWGTHLFLILLTFHFCQTSLLIFKFLMLVLANLNISKDQWQKITPFGDTTLPYIN